MDSKDWDWMIHSGMDSGKGERLDGPVQFLQGYGASGGITGKAHKGRYLFVPPGDLVWILRIASGLYKGQK